MTVTVRSASNAARWMGSSCADRTGDPARPGAVTAQWLAEASRDRGVRVHGDAAKALLQRFGSDVAALSTALDQLSASGEEEGVVGGVLITAVVRGRPIRIVAAGDVAAVE